MAARGHHSARRRRSTLAAGRGASWRHSRRGLPIGNLTSQFSANLYLDRFDNFVTEVLRAPYVRYGDDFALFHNDRLVLQEWRHLIDRYLEGRRLRLHPRKTVIISTSEPVAFLGYVLALDNRSDRSRSAGRGHRLLPDDNVRRFRGRLRGLRDRWRAGTISMPEVKARVGAWIGSR